MKPRDSKGRFTRYRTEQVIRRIVRLWESVLRRLADK